MSKRKIYSLSLFILCFMATINITGCCKKIEPLKEASNAYLSGDYKRAAEIFFPEAKKGNPEALVNLGFMHYCGLHVKQDFEKAAEYYKEAAELNNVNAQFSLGTMYENGEGVKRNLSKAYFWYLIAEQNGDEDAKKLRELASKRLSEKALKKVSKDVDNWYAKKQASDKK